MKKFAFLFFALVLSTAALAWTHGPAPVVNPSLLTPSAAWTGALLSGFSGGVAPASPTMTITGVASGGAESSCGSTCVQLTVATTAKFGSTGATGLSCVKWVQGAGEANGCWPYYVVSSTALDLLGSTYANGVLVPPNENYGGAQPTIGVAFGAQTVSAVAGDGTTYCNGGPCPLLTVSSTANMTNNDSFSFSISAR